jgi:hypothetical protein
MSRGARLAFLAVAVVILVVAFVALRPAAKDPETTADTPTTTPTATDTSTPEPGETETPTPKPTVDPGPLLTGSRVQKIRVDKGDSVRFRVRAPRDEEVHIHGYNIKKDVKGGQTARVSFKATIDGIFEIEFEDSATQIAELRVDP